MTAKAGYPFITKAIKRVLQTEVIPNGVFPSIDPETYDGWYELIIWNDSSVQKPSKESLENAIAEIRSELEVAGKFYPEYDVIV